MPTALHPQTLMAFRLSDEILPAKYGYPFKIRIPTKLGFKNPKFVTAIYVTDKQPRGYWTRSRLQLVQRHLTHGSAGDLRDRCHGEGAAARAGEDAAVPAAAAGAGRANSVPRSCVTSPRTSRLPSRSAPIHGCIAYAPAGDEGSFAGHLAEGTGLVLADGSPPMPPDVQGFGRCLLHAAQAMFAIGVRCRLSGEFGQPDLADRIADPGGARAAGAGRAGRAWPGGRWRLLPAGHEAAPSRTCSPTSPGARTVSRRRRARGRVRLASMWSRCRRGTMWMMRQRWTGLVAGADGGYAAPATNAWIERSGLRGRMSLAAQ